MPARLSFVFLFIAAAGLILRAPVNAFGPMADALESALGMRPETFGFIAGMPLFTFGVFAFLSNGLSRRALSSIAFYSLAGVLLGSCVRSLPQSALVLAGTVLLAASIAELNVILPVVIKRHFSHRAHAMTGFLCTMIGLSGAIGSFASVPLMTAFDAWQAPFLFWGAMTLPAFLFAKALGGAPLAEARALRAETPRCPSTSEKFRFPLRLGLIFGLQATISTLIANWLPTTLAAAGTPLNEGAALVALFFLATVPGAFAAPLLKPVSRHPLLPIILFCAFAGAIVLLGAAAASPLRHAAALAAGFAQGILMTLSFTLLQTESRDAADAFRLSSRVQGTGYCLAGLAPFAAAWLLGAASKMPTLAGIPKAHLVLTLVACAALLWSLLYGIASLRPPRQPA